MKNFLDLLDTEIWIDIEIVHAQGIDRFRWPLLTNVDFSCKNPVSVKIDGMEVLGFGWYQGSIWHIRHDEPFYRWRHRVTGQGWLLEPTESSNP